MNTKSTRTRLLTIFTLAVFFIVCARQTVFAARGDVIDATVAVTGFLGSAEQLSIKAGENMHDASGKELFSKDDDTGAAFEKRAGGYAASVSLYEGMKYYVSDGVNAVSFVADKTDIMVSFSGDGEIVTMQDVVEQTQDAVEDMTNTVGETASKMIVDGNSGESSPLKLKTKTPKEAVIGKRVTYVIDTLSTADNSLSDAFLLQVEVPDGMRLYCVNTGTYNKKVFIDVLCKTEKDDQWHMWYEGVDSTKEVVCDVSTSTIAEDDRITAFALSADNVPEGFAMNKDIPLTYTMEVIGNTDVNTEGLAKLTAYVGDQKASSEEKAEVTVKKDGSVQTGDENMLYVVSLIAMILSILTLLTYITLRLVFYKREKEIVKKKLPVVFKEYKGTTNEKMSDLLQNRPG